jgi:hypothetical protein
VALLKGVRPCTCLYIDSIFTWSDKALWSKGLQYHFVFWLIVDCFKSSKVASFYRFSCYYRFSDIQYIPSVSTIILSGPTYSSQNVRQIWESTLSKSDYLVGHFGLGQTFWSDVRVDIKRFFFTFLEVNMSNILWTMRICKRNFFPVYRMCGYVNTLVYFYLAPYSHQER